MQETGSGCKDGEAICELNETDNGEIDVTKGKSKHKKKKRKREKETEIDPTIELDDDDTSQAAESVSSHEKKRKKKKHKLSTESSTTTEKPREADDGSCENPPEDISPLVTCELGMEPIPVAKKKKRTKSKIQVEELVLTDEKSLVNERGEIIGSEAGSNVGSGPVEVAIEYINGCKPCGEEEKELGSDGKSKKKGKKHQRTEGESDGDALLVTSKKIKRESKEKLKKHKKHKH